MVGVSVSTFAQSVAQPIDVAAHRGDRVNFRENSLSAFKSAIESGASSIEFDVHLTKDGVPVIYHDYHLNPGDFVGISEPILIKDLTWVQLKNIRYNTEKTTIFENEAIPSLEGFLEFLAVLNKKRAQEIVLHLELKSENGHLEESAPIEKLVGETIAVIKKCNPKNEIIVRSFNWDVIGLFKRQMPEMRRILLIDENQFADIDVAATVEKYSPLQVAPHFRDVTPEGVRSWRKFGVGVSPWTVNDEKITIELVEMGVVGFATDNPHRSTKFLKARGYRISSPFICGEGIVSLGDGALQ